MKVVITLEVEREDGTHSGRMTYETEDQIDSPVVAMLAALPISAEVLDGLIYLFLHKDDDEEDEVRVPEAFRRAFET